MKIQDFFSRLGAVTEIGSTVLTGVYGVSPDMFPPEYEFPDFPQTEAVASVELSEPELKVDSVDGSYSVFLDNTSFDIVKVEHHETPRPNNEREDPLGVEIWAEYELNRKKDESKRQLEKQNLSSNVGGTAGKGPEGDDSVSSTSSKLFSNLDDGSNQRIQQSLLEKILDSNNNENTFPEEADAESQLKKKEIDDERRITNDRFKTTSYTNKGRGTWTKEDGTAWKKSDGPTRYFHPNDEKIISSRTAGDPSKGILYVGDHIRLSDFAIRFDDKPLMASLPTANGFRNRPSYRTYGMEKSKTTYLGNGGKINAEAENHGKPVVIGIGNVPDTAILLRESEYCQSDLHILTPLEVSDFSLGIACIANEQGWGQNDLRAALKLSRKNGNFSQSDQKKINNLVNRYGETNVSKILKEPMTIHEELHQYYDENGVLSREEVVHMIVPTYVNSELDHVGGSSAIRERVLMNDTLGDSQYSEYEKERGESMSSVETNTTDYSEDDSTRGQNEARSRSDNVVPLDEDTMEEGDSKKEILKEDNAVSKQNNELDQQVGVGRYNIQDHFTSNEQREPERLTDGRLLEHSGEARDNTNKQKVDNDRLLDNSNVPGKNDQYRKVDNSQLLSSTENLQNGIENATSNSSVYNSENKKDSNGNISGSNAQKKDKNQNNTQGVRQ
ncbi:hypothetical protein [Methanomethylophilus alvi]|uniref:hypothetical protein n=1 Tax=Methanomethylophilus alvi TaxID=1291540 RepID=UPI0037DDB8F3